jgi:Flp pilus assembly protein TadD
VVISTAQQGPPVQQEPRGSEILERVRVRQGAIVGAMCARDMERFHERLEDLVVYQRSTGRPVHLAKSLCYLATEAQRLGLHELQGDLTERATRECPDDVWSWSQRGRALQSAGDLRGALAAYDRALVFGGDARAHEEAAREHPEDVVAKNGRACVLAALGRSREALRALPHGRPAAENEWAGYRVHGMILLRTGKVDEAARILEDGAQSNPGLLGRDHFRTALAVVRLRQGRYADAAEVLGSVVQLRVEPQAELLRVHAFGAQGRSGEAGAAYLRLRPPRSPQVRELIDELRRRFVDGEPPRHDGAWLIRREIDACLLAV